MNTCPVTHENKYQELKTIQGTPKGPLSTTNNTLKTKLYPPKFTEDTKKEWASFTYNGPETNDHRIIQEHRYRNSLQNHYYNKEPPETKRTNSITKVVFTN
jgi:hypothetical protein